MKPHVLVVDDSELDIELAKSALEGQYHVTCVESGTACMDIVKSLNPDLILLDIVMRDVDGYEVCRLLKSSDETAFIPVIFLSALDQFSDKLEGFACGAEDYVSKPFDEDDLHSKIGHAIKVSSNQNSLYEQYRLNKLDSGGGRDQNDELYELSALVNFQRHCSRSSSYVELGRVVINACHVLGLDACLQLSTADGLRYFGCREKSLESDFLYTSFNNRKEIHTRTRSIYFSDYLTMLVKNIPQDNTKKYESIFDAVQTIADTASIRLSAMNAEYEKKKFKTNDAQRLKNVSYVMEKYLSRHNSEVKQNIREILDDIQLYVDALDVDPIVLIEFVRLIELCQGQTDLIDKLPDKHADVNKMLSELLFT